MLKGTNAQEKEERKKGRGDLLRRLRGGERAPARKLAHLGELLRERSRIGAAAEEYGKAHALVGDKYESISNKYALALLELKRLDEAEKVLRGSLRDAPGLASTPTCTWAASTWPQGLARRRTAYRAALAQDPFDPEIHLALLKSAQSLGDNPLLERARNGSAILTGVPVDRLPELLARLPGPQSDPSDVALPRGPAEPSRPPRPAAKKPVKTSEPTASERL